MVPSAEHQVKRVPEGQIALHRNVRKVGGVDVVYRLPELDLAFEILKEKPDCADVLMEALGISGLSLAFSVLSID